MSSIYGLTIQNLTAPSATLGTASISSVTLGGVQGSLNVAGDITLTGNLRQAFANTPAGGPADYTFGNLTAANINVATIANVKTLGVATIFCSNIVGYSSGVANTLNITGNSLTYQFLNLSNAFTSNGQVVLNNGLTSNGPVLLYNGLTSNGQVVLYNTLTSNGQVILYNSAFLNANSWLQNNNLFFRVSPDQNHFLGYNVGVDGPALMGYTGGQLGSTNGNVAVLVWNNQSALFNVPVGITGTQVLNMGSGFTKEQNAGRIGYQTYSTALDVVGAGSTSGSRAVRIWDQLGVNTVPGSGYNLDVSGPTRMQTRAVVGTATAPTVLALQNPANNTSSINIEAGSLTDNGGAGWNAINFNGYFSNGEQLVNTNRNRWRMLVDQRVANQEAMVFDQWNGSNSTGYMRFINGNVGIFNSNPQYPFDVAGVTRIAGASTSAPATLYLQNPSNSNGGPPLIGFYSYTNPVRPTPSTTVSAIDDGSYTAHLTFGTAPPGSGTSQNAPVERMRIQTTGNVGINTTQPLYQTHVQPSAAATPAINPDATNTLMVFEDCRGSTVSSGSLVGNASYVQNNCIALVQPANGVNGAINYNINPGTAFDVTVEMYVGNSTSQYNADAMYFYVYGSSASPGYSGGSNGYTVMFDDFSSSGSPGSFPYSVGLYYNGTLLASQTPSTFAVPIGQWTQVRMTFVRNIWRVWYGSQQVINYQDVSRTLVGPNTMNMGFGANTGGSNAGHYVRNISITKHTIGHWRPASGGNVAGISYNGPVSINGSLAVAQGSAFVSTAANAIVSMYNNYQPGPGLGPVISMQGTGNSGANVGLFMSGYNTRPTPCVTVLAQDDGAAGAHLIFSNALTGNNGNNVAAERMRISSANGFVGINQPSPQYQLDVNGSARVAGPLIQSSPVYGQYNMVNVTCNNTQAGLTPFTLASGNISVNGSGQPVAPYTGLYSFQINFWASAQNVLELFVYSSGSQTNRVINQYAAGNVLNLSRFVMGGSLYMVAGDYFTFTISTNGNNTISQGNGPAFALFLMQRTA